MAISPLGGFANLSRYQQAAVQPQPNVLDQFVQALNQGISLAQLPQTLQAEAQQRQQNAILNAIKVATAQKNLYDLQHPDEVMANEVKRQLTLQNVQRQLAGAEVAPAGLGGQIIAAPGAIADVGGDLTGITQRPAGAPLGVPTTPIAPYGIQTGFNYNPQLPIQAAERARAQELIDIEAKEAAEGRGRIAFEKAKIEAEAKAKAAAAGTKTTELRFEKVGNTVIAFDPFTSKEVSRTEIPVGFVDVKTENGLFIGKPNDASSFKLVPGTAPIVTQAENVSEDYRTRKSEEILNSIKGLKARVGLNTVGVGGSIGRKAPLNTEAKDFAADLTALTSQIAFKELAEMRAASKTGGALGQVSDKEGELLKSAIAGLSLDQSPENFTKNLNRIQESIERWDAAKAKHGTQTPASAAPSPAPAPVKTREEMNSLKARFGLPSN